MKFIGIKMLGSRFLFLAVLLCYATQPQDVLAGKQRLGPRNLQDWIEFVGSGGSSYSDSAAITLARTCVGASGVKNIKGWHLRTRWGGGGPVLTTEVGPGSTSWFITPLLNLPNTSYLVIETLCYRRPCQLEVNGRLDIRYNNYELIENVTFGNQSFKNITIKKPYSQLRVLARAAVQRTKFSIYSIRMYHYFCEKAIKYKTNLSLVDSSTTNISKQVQCLDNSVANDGKSRNITIVCTPEGEWMVRDQECVCDKGFFPNYQRCSRCPSYYYKSVIGNTKCKRCPDGKRNTTMHRKCECKQDHYIGKDEDEQCYTVPSAVKELYFQTLTRTSVNVTWHKLEYCEGSLITYTVECYHCIDKFKCDDIAGNVKFFPAKTNLNKTYVVVSNLTFKEDYKFKVTSINNWLKNVSSDKWKFSIAGYHSVATVQATTSKSKSKESSTLNSIAPYFVGSTVFLIVLLLVSIVVFIIIYKKRLQTPTSSTPPVVEMTNQSRAEPSRNRQAEDYAIPGESGYLNPVEIEPYAITDISSGYTELNRIRLDETSNNNYQELIKHSSDNVTAPQAHADISNEEPDE